MSSIVIGNEIFKHAKVGGCCATCKHDIEAERAKFAKLRDARRVREFTKEISVKGKKGDRAFVTVTLEQACRIEKFVAVDTAGNEGTTIAFPTMMTSHDHFKKPKFTNEWAPDSLGCGVSFGRFEAGSEFAIELTFLADCEWHAAILGIVAL